MSFYKDVLLLIFRHVAFFSREHCKMIRSVSRFSRDDVVIAKRFHFFQTLLIRQRLKYIVPLYHYIPTSDPEGWCDGWTCEDGCTSDAHHRPPWEFFRDARFDLAKCRTCAAWFRSWDRSACRGCKANLMFSLVEREMREEHQQAKEKAIDALREAEDDKIERELRVTEKKFLKSKRNRPCHARSKNTTQKSFKK